MTASTAASHVDVPKPGAPEVHGGVTSDDALGCPACHARIEIGASSARCTNCAASFDVHDGVLCTHRENVFMGEFNASRMMDFVRLAREKGWRRTVRESMAAENRATETILMSPQRGSFMPLLMPHATRRVLDVGAGMGAVSMQLSGMFEQVYSLDQAFERLAFLQVIADEERRGGIRTLCHRDVFRLPFQSGVLDAVVMIGVFEYFPASYPGMAIEQVQERALAELYRVLAPGGVLFMATKNRFGWPYWLGAKDNSGVRFGPPLPRALADLMSRALLRRPFRVVTDSHRSYDAMLRRAGFGQPKFYWPIVGYQAPKCWVDLDDERAVRQGIADYPTGTAKRSFFSALAAVGALKHAVPNFGILARKPPA